MFHHGQPRVLHVLYRVQQRTLARPAYRVLDDRIGQGKPPILERFKEGGYGVTRGQEPSVPAIGMQRALKQAFTRCRTALGVRYRVLDTFLLLTTLKCQRYELHTEAVCKQDENG
jgi:hypothetical protein